MPIFIPFPSIPRFNRALIGTEKMDGTNAAIGVTEDGEVYAQSRTRLISVDDDNFGFAAWVEERADVLRKRLGPGLHNGEWWGSGIQRGYGLAKGEKRFSLFNTSKYTCFGNSGDPDKIEGTPSDYICHECPVVCVVPVLFVLEKPDTVAINHEMFKLAEYGSKAAPGFMRPEGIVLYHSAANMCFKATILKDEVPKYLADRGLS